MAKVKYVVTDKKTHEIICTGSVREICKVLHVSETVVREHYYDRNNAKRFVDCSWRVDKEFYED